VLLRGVETLVDTPGKYAIYVARPDSVIDDHTPRGPL
jgi:hypothetical protein